MTYPPPRSDDTELRREDEARERTDDENDDNGPVEPEDPELRRTVDTRDPDEPDDSADEPGDEEPDEPGEEPEDPELRRDVETPEPTDEAGEGEEDEEDEDEGEGGEPPPEDPELRRDFEPSGQVAEPAPQPTAFGAATVGGAAAAAALAEPGPRSDRTTVGDSPVTEDLDRPGRDGAVPDRAPTEPAVGVASVDEVRAATPDTAEPEEAPAAAEEPLTREEPVAAEEPVGLLPGQAESEAVVAVWDGDTTQTYRERWRELQLRFVDDPEGATGEAQALVGEAVDALTSSLIEQRTDLDGWRSGEDGGDTEHLRVALRRYRDFFDRLMNL